MKHKSGKFGQSITAQESLVLMDFFRQEPEIREIILSRLHKNWSRILFFGFFGAVGDDITFQKGSGEVVKAYMTKLDLWLIRRVLFFDAYTFLVFVFWFITCTAATLIIFYFRENLGLMVIVFFLYMYFLVAFFVRVGVTTNPSQGLFFDQLKAEIELSKSPLSYLIDEN